MNKLSVCGVAMAIGLLWAGAILFVGLINRWCPTYGSSFLYVVDSIYPGYHAITGLKNLIWGVLYALVDGAIGGAIFAWIYNFITVRCCCGTKKDDAEKCC